MSSALLRNAFALGFAAMLVSCGCGSSATPPSIIRLLSPSNAATDISLTPVLDWADYPGAATYTVEIDDDSTFGSPVIDDATLAVSTYTVSTPLTASVVYYWRVTAVDASGSTIADNSARFTTLPAPGAFSLLAPTDSAIGVWPMPTFDWEDSSYAAAYTLQVDADPAFGSPLIDDTTLAVSTYTVSAPLAADVVYYWRVTAVNASGSTPADNNTLSFATTPCFADMGAGLPGVRNCALAWGDYDNDGDLDLALTGGTSPTIPYNPISRIYRNDNGTFNDINAGLLAVYSGSLAWGDYDNDGDLDLALTGYDGSKQWSRIYRNDGGTFTDISAGLTGLSACSIAWGDYDNDGDLDLALAGYDGSDKLSMIYRNDGGTFTDIGAGLTGLSTGSLAWGDYDNDGDLDLAMAGLWSGGRISLIYRNDSGAFTNIGAALIGVYGSSLAWGDYDNDGDLDLALSGDKGSTKISRIYRNDGGTFTDINAGLIGVSYCALAWGDCDNDGDLDLALAGNSSSGRVSGIYRNDGGTFVEIYAPLPGVVFCALAWGDYDNDGDLDLALGGSTDIGVVSGIYRNDGGTFNGAPTAPMGQSAVANGCDVAFSWSAASDAETASAGLSYNLRVGTAPGLDDVFSGMADTASGMRLLPATGSAQKVLSWTVRNLHGGTYHWSVQAIDSAYSGSAWATEGIVSVTGPAIRVTLPTGGESLPGGSTAAISWVSAGVTNVRIELSRNGGTNWENIIASTPAAAGTYSWTVTAPASNSCLIRISDASAPTTTDTTDSTFVIPLFGDINAGLAEPHLGRIAWGDYDNDGDLDIAHAYAWYDGTYHYESKVYRNDAGTFVDIAAGLTGVSGSPPAWGDYDNDGDLDLALAGYDGSSQISKIYQNNGGTFSAIGAGLTGVSGGSAIVWGDYDNDGDLDIALAGDDGTGNISKIYRNDSGTFTAIGAGLVGVRGCFLSWGDYDNDGDLDLALAGDDGSAYVSKIYRNDGGVFSDIGAGLTGTAHGCAIVWGDYDNDGDLDLVLIGSYAVGIIYSNDGGTFTDINAGLTAVGDHASVAWGDYDNDGDLDIALTGYNSGKHLKVYRNDNGVFTVLSDTGLPTVVADSLAWGDYDNDGDLDLAVAGTIYRNASAVANAAPAAPTGLGASYSGTGPYDLTLSWSAPVVADETPDDGLSYNLRVGTTSGGNEIFSGHADAASGKRRIAARGIVQPGASSNEWTLTLPAGIYYWSVQAVDTVFEGGAWAAEETVTVP